MIVNTEQDFRNPVRTLSCVANMYSSIDSTFYKGFSGRNIKDITIERVGEESKFFGYGVCQKLNIKLLDVKRELNITTDNYFEVYIYNTNTSTAFRFAPKFYVTEVHRNENTNELSVTAYDLLYKASSHTVAELALTPPYNINDFVKAVGEYMGFLSIWLQNIDARMSDISFDSGANFEGSETLRDALNYAAETMQAIYYVSGANILVFKRLDSSGDAVLTIEKDDYFELESSGNRRLSTIVHATELGDNVSVTTGATGTTQYIRDNPFLELREDIDTILNNALDNIGGLTINQFSCNWRGNLLLEIGDKFGIVTKDNATVYSYLLNDVVYFDGSLSQETQWSYEDNEEEEAINPVSIGDALRQTYARIDKANKQIDLVVSQTEDNKEQLSNLQLTTEDITASVQKVEKNINESLSSLSSDVSTLSSKVEASITSEDVTIAIQTELSNGVDRVVTSTGFTFNDEGLTVSKSGSEMETTITEDGMTVYRDEEPVLTANNIGVNATNLHATTYLIVGTNSRFEDFGSDRTGCFWIGGIN